MKTPDKKDRDFSIIFQEIEKYNSQDPSIKDNMIKEDELKQEQSIRVFGEICREINTVENSSNVFVTFS